MPRTPRQHAAQKDQEAITQAQTSQQATALKDQQSIQQAQNSLTNAQISAQGATLKDQQSVASAQQQLANAQNSQQSTAANNAVKASPPTDATVASDQASLDNAQAQLDTAQTNLNNTTLVAPVDGTVSAINGAVGEQAGEGLATSSSSSGAASSSTANAGSAGSGFMTLTDLHSLQVVAGFAESDAAKIQLGQAATVSFNAIPNQNFAGSVSQVQINSEVVSNVVTYNATISIPNPPPSLKPGMTANVSVTTAEQDNVLTLPSSAVTAAGSTTTLQVQGADGKPVARLVTIGLRGDTNDEITSGLSVGDKVIISRTSGGSGTTAGAGAAGLRLGGAGGLGGLGGAGAAFGRGG